MAVLTASSMLFLAPTNVTTPSSQTSDNIPLYQINKTSVRRRRSLQAKATSNVLVAVVFFPFDATAQQRLDGFTPKLHQFGKRRLCGVIR